MKTMIASALAAALAASAAQALPPLKDNERVQREFLAAAIGDEIRKNCPTISARFFRFLKRRQELKDYALSLGYSMDDIEAMLDDEGAEAWLKAQRDHYLAKNGVVTGDAESYCRLGMAEIAKNSLTGWLLREN